MFKHIWAFLTGRKVVILRDDDGETALSVAYKNEWGELCAKRYWPFEIRIVILNEDGTVSPRSYVKKWKWYKHDGGK